MVVSIPLFSPLTVSYMSISPPVVPQDPVAGSNQNAGHAPFSNGIFSALNAINLFGSNFSLNMSFKLSMHWLVPYFTQP